MKLAEHGSCTGCGACAKACPKQAIEFYIDEEGFPTPAVQEDKCVNCGRCSQVCPALHMPETHPVQKAYAAQTRDRDVLRDSTSGGVFTALAREVFRRGGLVYGCVWDEQYNAVLKKAENEEELQPMRGSKYVWSWAGDTYPEIRDNLESGRIVLFTGQPCQVAGLKNYLRKDYDNLYLVDFLCSGTPSPLALQKYLDTICPSGNYAGLNLKFRDKNPHGVGVHITYSGQKKPSKPRGEHITNPYYYAFYSHLTTRRSCYQCPHRTGDRASDITICDYWGVQKYHPGMDIRGGISGLFVNSDRGAALLNAVRSELQLEETKPESIAAANNISFSGKRKFFRAPAYREAFFQTLQAKGWKAAERKYLRNMSRLKQWIMVKLPPKLLARLKRLLGR